MNNERIAERIIAHAQRCPNQRQCRACGWYYCGLLGCDCGEKA